MKNEVVRFACNGCGECCKTRLIPLTLEEAKGWLNRGGDVAIILEAFDESTWAETGQFNHSAQRAVEVTSGDARIRVIAVFAGNALTQCPSLGEDNRCGIYDERPLVCRIYPMEINPFIALRPEEKICPPEVWQSGDILFSDRIVDPTLYDHVQRSRQADRDDAKAKIAICEAIGFLVASWKGNALAIYLPNREVLLRALNTPDSGASGSESSHWKIRTENIELKNSLISSGVELDLAEQTDYILHPL